MRNHFRLALETPEPNSSFGMKWLQGTWAVRFNRFRSEVGQPFQGRYKALHVERGEALARVTDYIHLNPVRVGVMPFEKLGEYPWSSLRLSPRRHRPSFLEPQNLLLRASLLRASDPCGHHRGERVHFFRVFREFRGHPIVRPG